VWVSLPRPRSTILIASDVRVMWATAYLGLVRRRYQSGEIDYTGSISRCGHGRLRMGGSASGDRLLPAWSSAG
jgi:transposase